MNDVSSEKWLLVLGANSDMAVAIGRRFAQAGWHIQLASRNIEALQTEAKHLQVAYGIEAEAYLFDARDLASHAVFYNALVHKPDGVVVAFGLLGDQTASQADFNQAQEIIETNYTGAVSISEIVAADMEQRQAGFIVGISSVAGDRGRASNYIYGSSKAAFSAYLSGLRHRLFKSGVHVMTVKPGFVATKMTEGLDLPAKLTATPQEVAQAVFNGVSKRKNVLYVKWMWRYIMLIIIHLPSFIFNKTKL
ncbi:MAG: SDR family oxidoreductase [Proteobacteria bacterium]|nr:SDR family oxidoreductase [Pseudomonadota bacterium]